VSEGCVCSLMIYATLGKSWLWLEGHGSAPIRAVVWTDRPGAAVGEDHKIPNIAYARIEGWTSFDHRYLPIGGFLAAVKAVKKVKIEFTFEAGAGLIYVYGHLNPPLANIPITIEVTDEKGNSWLLYSVTNAHGSFTYNPTNQNLRFQKGFYNVQVFVTAGGNAAEGESGIAKVEMH
jgi:hypothetical protein